MEKHSEYELVPKKTLKVLKEENLNLKKEIEKLKSDNSKLKTIEFFKEEILEEFKIETKKEREIISMNLENIKELNQSSINEISKSNISFESQIEELIKNLKGFIETIENDKKDKDFKQKDEVKNLFENFLEEITLNNMEQIKLIKEDKNLFLELKDKVESIEDFLKNLKTLLSYVTPNNIKIDRTNNKK